MFFDTALRHDVQRRLQEIGQADIVVGIPSYRNAKTIGQVIRKVAEGLLQYFPGQRCLLVNADGMSTDDTFQVATQTPVPDGVEKIVTTYQGLMGKGSAVRAMFEMTQVLKAKVCIVVDADLKNLTADWLHALAAPILRGEYDYTVPYYSRPIGDVTITRQLAYPMIRMLYGADLLQPIGGEVAVSAELARFFLEKDVWETDVARFGIHVWMTVLAFNEGWRIGQVPLGTKVHDFKDPVTGFEPKFLQVVGTLFRLMSIYRRRWPTVWTVRPVPFCSEPTIVEPEPIPDTSRILLEAFRKGEKRYKRMWKNILLSEHLEAVGHIAGQEGDVLSFPYDLWARVVCDFAVVYNKGEGDPDKVVMALLPLYYGRVASFINETRGMNYAQALKVVEALATTFQAQKHYLIERWNTYTAW